MKIKVLDDRTINKIAAGEVVERPAAVIREVLENAIDAGADDVRIDLEAGGSRLIRIRDNGCGMNPEDAKLCLQRHATSKIRTDKDLFSVTTLGFRGEAIPSIASVSKFEIITRPHDSPVGTKVVVEGGKQIGFEEFGCPVGTTLTARNLFYNVPARKKFLRTEATELSHCLEAVIREALIRPNLDIEVRHNRSVVIRAPKTESLVQRATALLGNSCASLIEINFEFSGVKVRGLVSPVGIHRASSQNASYLYVNDRYVKDTAIRRAVKDAYAGLVPKGRYPTVILAINLDPSKVDVNVHPAKTEVRFHQVREMGQGLTQGLRNALQEHGIKRESKVRKEKLYVEQGTMNQALPFSFSTGRTAPRLEFPSVVAQPSALPPQSAAAPTPLPARQEQPKPQAFAIDERQFPPAITCQMHGNVVRDEAEPLVIPTPSPLDSLAVQWPSYDEEKDLEYSAGELLPVPRFCDLRVIGQVGLTYLLCEGKGELVIIDQHAAHERITLHALQQNATYNLGGAQILLAPIVVELTPMRLHAIEPYYNVLRQYGLEVESFGGNAIVIRQVPEILEGSDWQQLMEDVADDIAEGGRGTPIHERVQNIFASRACHNSIRAGDRLSTFQMREMLEDLDAVDFGVCAHGRPVAIRITPAELEKRFHRN